MIASYRTVRLYTREAVVAIVTICALATASALAWLYLLVGHGGYWRTSPRLPPSPRAPLPLPAVTAVIPARNEAGILPACLPSLLGQEYEGPLSFVLVDDDSSDDTAKVATSLGADHDRELDVVTARPTPAGWAGKVWAMAEGLRAVSQDADYILFTDADIAYRPGTLRKLALAASGEDYAIVSQMALLRTGSRWEKLLIPAFVYFFAQLYPFSRVSRPRSRTAAAAGGCMLVKADALTKAGGLKAIRGARIDDVALGRLLKRAGGRCWLGLSTDVVSMRPYDRLADIWDMIARSAYTQLRHSVALTAGTVVGLAWLYLLPPAAVVAGLVLLALGPATAATGTAAWLTAAGLAGWLGMSITYLPMLRLYRLSALRAPTLPLIAAMYAAMTADSARRHLRGRGGEWKGRVVVSASREQGQG
jgi:hopene-associated glycosyltransferase HpnB